MGEAKRRAAVRAGEEERLAGVDLPRLARAMHKLATAASERLGSDCYLHAALAQAVLARLGVRAELCVGTAAWRVGPGDGDVIVHAPISGMVPQPGGVPYHAWLKVGNRLIDFTLHTIRAKASLLDALDGGKTNVTWAPEYLCVDRGEISPLDDVRRLGPGLFYYCEDPDLAATVLAGARHCDPADVEALWMLYHNEEVELVGPFSGEPERRAR